MPTRQTALGALRNRLALALTVVAVAALAATGDVGRLAGALCADPEDRQGRRAGEPLGRHRSLHRRGLRLLRRSGCGRKTAALPAGRRGRLPLWHRPARGHGRPVRGVPEHGRSRGPQQAQPLQHQRELLGMAQVRADRLLRRRPGGSPLLGRLSGMGRQALRLRQLPALGPLRQLPLQRPAALQARQRQRRLPLRHLPGPALAADRAGDVRHEGAGDDPLAQDRLRHSQPERVDQGGLLRPQRRRQVLLLEVPDQPRRVRRRTATRSALDDARPHDRRRHQRLDPAAGELPRRKSAGAELVPVRLQRRSLLERRTRSGSTPTDLREGLPGQPQHGRPGEDHLALGDPRPGRQRGRVDRHDHAAPVRGATGSGSGGACTAASPTPPSTSSGSRRSACSRRTTPSTPPPIRGSASGSACSAT